MILDAVMLLLQHAHGDFRRMREPHRLTVVPLISVA